MGEIEVRKGTTADAELIAKVSRETFFETFSPFNTVENMDKFMREQFSKEKLMQEVGEPENIFLLAYLEG